MIFTCHKLRGENMRKNIERARDLVPAMMLTVLSMIQALALELYWSKIGSSPFLWAGGWEAVIGWLQLLAMFMGILLIWVLYVSFVLRFTWLPSMEDTLVPFLIGALEFAMVDTLDPQLLGPWMLLLCAVFALAIFTSHTTMRRARREVENAYFFDSVGPASWRDFLGSAITLSVLGLFGVALMIIGFNPYLALAALSVAITALALQYVQARKYWMHSLVPEGD
jgi:hypothetical protein